MYNQACFKAWLYTTAHVAKLNPFNIFVFLLQWGCLNDKNTVKVQIFIQMLDEFRETAIVEENKNNLLNAAFLQ